MGWACGGRHTHHGTSQAERIAYASSPIRLLPQVPGTSQEALYVTGRPGAINDQVRTISHMLAMVFRLLAVLVKLQIGLCPGQFAGLAPLLGMLVSTRACTRSLCLSCVPRLHACTHTHARTRVRAGKHWHAAGDAGAAADTWAGRRGRFLQEHTDGPSAAGI